MTQQGSEIDFCVKKFSSQDILVQPPPAYYFFYVRSHRREFLDEMLWPASKTCHYENHADGRCFRIQFRCILCFQQFYFDINLWQENIVCHFLTPPPPHITVLGFSNPPVIPPIFYWAIKSLFTRQAVGSGGHRLMVNTGCRSNVNLVVQTAIAATATKALLPRCSTSLTAKHVRS